MSGRKPSCARPSRLRCESLEDRSVPASNFWAVATGGGVPGMVQFLNSDNTVRLAVTPFGSDFTGAVRAAAGDVTGDGVPDLIAAAGAGGGPAVVVYDGATGQELRRFFALDSAFTGGLSVTAGDVNRDAYADIIVAAGAGGGPVVRTFDGKTGADLGSFFAYDPGFRGGVSLSAADLDGDDRAEIITGVGAGGGPHVRAFLPNGTVLLNFFAYSPDFRGGVNVAGGDVTGDGVAEVVAGAGADGAPHVRLFDGRTGADRGGFFAADSSLRTGAGVGVRFLDGDPHGVICAAVGDGVRDFDGRTFAARADGPVTAAHAQIGSACTADGDSVLDWTATMLQTVWRTTTSPPQGSRAMAIVSTAVYDAVNAITGGFASYLEAAPAPAGASVDAAVSAAAARTLSALFPDRAAEYAAKLAGSLAALAVSDKAKADGVAVGNAAADAILAARANDGATASVPYTVGTNPGDYQLTPPAFRASLLPQWPNLTPFALTSGDQFRPPAPPALTSAEYATAVDEVKRFGRAEGSERTADQTQIALFWADNPGASPTPPGHWFDIALRLSKEKGLTTAENARLFALLGIAVADAGIVSWDAKYEYNLWRPITAIRSADTDGNSATTPDAAWSPLLTTPNFPTYTSGHSTFSGAAATILDAVFGANAPFSTSSAFLPGAVRSFANFQAAAAEAGQSRIYGGIHFQFDNQAGLVSGRAIGQYVVANFLRPSSPV